MYLARTVKVKGQNYIYIKALVFIMISILKCPKNSLEKN